MNQEVENFYFEYQDELERDYAEYAYLRRCEGHDHITRDNDDAFWEFVEDQMEQARAVGEGYL